MPLSNTQNGTTKTPGYIRPAAVAGLFYPGDPAELRQAVTTYLDNARTHGTDPVPKAVIVPHAGYVYSGAVAAQAYAALKPLRQIIKRVILLGPAHRVYLQGLALSGATSFTTPLGSIDIDLVATEILKNLPQVAVMEAAHTQEHSLEVQLPFLQSVLDSFTLLPIVVGETTPEAVTEVLEAVWGGDETLIVISSDLSHYHDYETARKLDTATSYAIENFQLDKIGPQQACGCMPMRGLLLLAKRREMGIRTLDLRNSGDSAGPRDQVVGYGAYCLYPDQVLAPEQRRRLLAVARHSIEQGFGSDAPFEPELETYGQQLREKRATFVTLKIDSALRGCIGTTEAVAPLIASVAESAFNAAFRDPRFSPLTRDEFEHTKLSISVLSPPTQIHFTSETDFLQQLRPGSDGLIIEKGNAKATFLPEVWKSLPTPQDFLSQLKLKAGLRSGDTPDHAWRYSTESFSE